MKKVLVITVVVAIIAVVVFMGLNSQNKADAPSTASNTDNSSTSSGDCRSTDKPADGDNQITYNGSSYSPKSLKVKVGDNVTIVNASTCAMQFDSDPHPVHTDNKELNIEFIASGSSKTFKVNEKGTHGYHNHLNSSQTGTLIVE